MAVVQISKIQVRRGKKSQTNLPQLSGGEFGWAVDTQQLYVGNGSVGEGAPFVGNTEILTERSNIFNLLGAYSYQGYQLDNNGNSIVQTGSNPNTPYGRSLQQKLDDIVNVRDFGALGDYENGVGTDDTAAIQRAIDQIFLNSSNKTAVRSRRTLYFPAGTYKITSELYIPSNATLIGEGIDKAIILQDVDTKNTLRTVANNSTPGVYKLMDSSPIDFNDNTAPTNVFISGFSFIRKDGSQTDTPIALFDCLTQSSIRRCKFQGVWQNNDGEDALGASSAIQFRGIGAVTSEYVTIIECEFSNVSHAVYSDYDTNNIQFKDCYFKNLYRAFTLAKNSTNITGRSAGPQYYTVEHCTFDKIDGEAIKVFATASSKGHRSIANTYLDVGNNSLEQSQPVTPVIDFRVPECDTVGDYFQRSIDVNNLDQNKTGLNSSMVAYLPDVLGVDSVQYSSKSTTLFFNTQELTPKILVKAPCWGSTKLTINYSIRKGSSTLYRVGQIVVNAHPDMTSGPITPSITDNFTYTGPTDTYGQTIGGNIRFIATVLNMTAIQIVDNGGVKTPVLTTKPTLVVRYINPAGPGGNATINYTVTIDSGYQDF
jgi:hypothetical protein